jgi:hypothetical protein
MVNCVFILGTSKVVEVLIPKMATRQELIPIVAKAGGYGRVTTWFVDPDSVGPPWKEGQKVTIRASPKKR